MGRERSSDLIAVDTSALIAILRNEPERAAFLEVLQQAGTVLISPGTVIECRLVCHRRGGQALVDQLEELLAAISVVVAPLEPADLDIAHAAFVQFGKGSGHPACLNFGDLFSYALAKAREAPLLYKGDDFALTDMEAAA